MPKKGKAPTPQALKLQQPKREHRYKEQINALASEVCAQKSSLQLEVEQQQQAQERQKVLVDFINCQEELTRLLQYHHSLLQHTSSCSASEAKASPPAGLISGNNRFNCVLAAAPAELIQQVVSLQQPGDWMKLAVEHFREQVVLLEMADRELSSANSIPLDRAATAGSASDDPLQTAGDAAAAAAGDDGDYAAPALDGTASDKDKDGPGTSALQQLERLVLHGLCVCGLALLHNPVPYYISATCNYLTGQVETVPPKHVMRVLSRLRLSDLQLLHLRIAFEEYERLSRDAQQEGGQLSEQIARLSLQQLVKDVTQQQQQQEQQQIPFAEQEPHKPTQVATSAAAAAAAAAAEVATEYIAADDTVRQQLMSHMNRYLGRINIHTCVTAWFVINTLTIRQLAIVNIASFPYAPAVHAVAEAAKQLHKQRQQERLAKIARRVSAEKVLETAEGSDQGSAPSATGEEQQQQQQALLSQQDQPQRTESDAQYDAFDREVAEYMERRNVMLQQQVQQWWLDIGALP